MLTALDRVAWSRDLLMAERAFPGLSFIDGRFKVDESVAKALAQRAIHSSSAAF